MRLCGCVALRDAVRLLRGAGGPPGLVLCQYLAAYWAAVFAGAVGGPPPAGGTAEAPRPVTERARAAAWDVVRHCVAALERYAGPGPAPQDPGPCDEGDSDRDPPPHGSGSERAVSDAGVDRDPARAAPVDGSGLPRRRSSEGSAGAESAAVPRCTGGGDPFALLFEDLRASRALGVSFLSFRPQWLCRYTAAVAPEIAHCASLDACVHVRAPGSRAPLAYILLSLQGFLSAYWHCLDPGGLLPLLRPLPPHLCSCLAIICHVRRGHMHAVADALAAAGQPLLVADIAQHYPVPPAVLRHLLAQLQERLGSEGVKGQYQALLQHFCVRLSPEEFRQALPEGDAGTEAAEWGQAYLRRCGEAARAQRLFEQVLMAPSTAPTPASPRPII